MRQEEKEEEEEEAGGADAAIVVADLAAAALAARSMSRMVVRFFLVCSFLRGILGSILTNGAILLKLMEALNRRSGPVQMACSVELYRSRLPSATTPLGPRVTAALMAC